MCYSVLAALFGAMCLGETHFLYTKSMRSAVTGNRDIDPLSVLWHGAVQAILAALVLAGFYDGRRVTGYEVFGLFIATLTYHTLADLIEVISVLLNPKRTLDAETRQSLLVLRFFIYSICIIFLTSLIIK